MILLFHFLLFCLDKYLVVLFCIFFAIELIITFTLLFVFVLYKHYFSILILNLIQSGWQNCHCSA